MRRFVVGSLPPLLAVLLLLGLIVRAQLAARDDALRNASTQISGLNRAYTSLQAELSGVRDDRTRLTAELAAQTAERDNLQGLLTAFTERESLRTMLDAARQQLADDQAALGELRSRLDAASARASAVDDVLEVDQQIASVLPRLTRELDLQGAAFSRRDYLGAVAAYRRGRVVLNQLTDLLAARAEALERLRINLTRA